MVSTVKGVLWKPRWFGDLLEVNLLVALLANPAKSQTAELQEAETLTQRMGQLYRAGHYEKALPRYQRPPPCRS
jgi:hypothetical protein